MDFTGLVRALVSAGATPEMILAAVQSQDEYRALKREASRQRQIRKREKSLNNNIRVTVTTRDIPSPPFSPPSLSPTPPNITPPITPPTPEEAPALPPWLPLIEWNAFRQMRSKIRKPMTSHAEKLALGKLSKLRTSGHDAGQILDNSTMNGWQDLYEPKANGHAKFEEKSIGKVDSLEDKARRSEILRKYQN